MKSLINLSLTVTVFAFMGCETLHFPDPHGHVVDVHEQPWHTTMADDILIMQVPVIDKDPRRNVVVNPNQTMVAFTVKAGGPPDWQLEHVYFQDLQSKERFVILGVPLPYRRFSDLTWVQDRYLVFDRWSQPHYGIHYVVDALEKKVLLATPFPDQFYLDSQGPK